MTLRRHRRCHSTEVRRFAEWFYFFSSLSLLVVSTRCLVCNLWKEFCHSFLGLLYREWERERDVLVNNQKKIFIKINDPEGSSICSLSRLFFLFAFSPSLVAAARREVFCWAENCVMNKFVRFGESPSQARVDFSWTFSRWTYSDRIETISDFVHILEPFSSENGTWHTQAFSTCCDKKFVILSPLSSALLTDEVSNDLGWGFLGLVEKLF